MGSIAFFVIRIAVGGEHVWKLRFILRPLGSEDCPLHSKSRGSAKVVAATQFEQVAALFPVIYCSAKRGFAGALFQNMLSSVAEVVTKDQRPENSCSFMFFLLSMQCNAIATCGREERDGRSLCHTYSGGASKNGTRLSRNLDV